MNVADLLTFGGLKKAKVAAGKKALMAPVDGVSVLEVAESQISRWVQQNELYISSFYAIADNIDMQKIVIEALHKSGCSGLVLCHVGQIIKEPHKEIIQLCNTLSFPLIIANTKSTFAEIITPIIRRLTDEEENKGNAKATASFVRNDVVDLISYESDSYEILKKVSSLYDIEVTFIDSSLQCAYSNKHEAIKEKELQFVADTYRFKEQLAYEEQRIITLQKQQKYLCTVRNKQSFLGLIILDITNKTEQQRRPKIIDELMVPCRIALGKLRHRIENRVVDKFEYISDLLVWNFPSFETAVNRGLALGCKIIDKDSILVININAIQPAKDARPISNYIQTWFMPNIIGMVKQYNADNFVALQSDTIICFLTCNKSQAIIDELCKKIIKLFASSERTSISVGYSNTFTNVTEIPEAYNQAFHGAVIGREMLGVNKACSYSDIQLIHIVKNMQKDKKLIAVCERVLHPLIHYDKEHNADLLLTLQTILSCHLCMAEAAKKLFVHRNTLQYRRKKIEEILNYNPFAMPHLMNITMADYVYRGSSAVTKEH